MPKHLLKPSPQKMIYHLRSHTQTPRPVDSPSVSVSHLDEPSDIGDRKRRKTFPTDAVLSASPPMNRPSVSAVPSSAIVHSEVPPAELMRALQSIFAQTDWSQVVIDVVGREKSTMYQNAFKARMMEILNPEGLRYSYSTEGESERPKIVMNDIEKPEYMVKTEQETKDMKAVGPEIEDSGRVEKEVNGSCSSEDDSLSFVRNEEKLGSEYDGDHEDDKFCR